MRRRADLAEFLRVRRAALSPDDVGLPRGARRRTQGLRREEVAMLANVSVSWYTWLEQGRPVNASVDVLDALARALRLDPVERDHLLLLAGHPMRRATELDVNEVPQSLHVLLDALEPSPAYVLGPRWDVLALNHAQQRLYPPMATLTGDRCNLVWIVFAEPDARELIGDWENEARRILSQFRAETTSFRDDPAVRRLVDSLIDASPEFAAWWPRHDVGGFQSRIRTFHHPIAGLLKFEHEQLVPADVPDLRVVCHLALPGDDSVERLAAVGRD